MSNIDKRALREAAEKALPAMQRLLMMPNDELFDEELLNVDGDVDAANTFNLLTGPETVLALLDELGSTYSRIGELEVIATDYGMKFQRAQDALKHQSLLHKSEMEAAEKRIAELTESFKQTVSGYKSCLRTGHERILDLGGECDSPEVMIAGNPDIQQAEKLLEAAAGKGE